MNAYLKLMSVSPVAERATVRVFFRRGVLRRKSVQWQQLVLNLILGPVPQGPVPFEAGPTGPPARTYLRQAAGPTLGQPQCRVCSQGEQSRPQNLVEGPIPPNLPGPAHTLARRLCSKPLSCLVRTSCVHPGL